MMWDTHTKLHPQEYYLVVKKEILSCDNMDEPGGGYTK